MYNSYYYTYILLYFTGVDYGESLWYTIGTMDEDRPLERRRCAAMIAEGVYDPDSKEGIDFCVYYCPYEYCVVMETGLTKPQLVTWKKVSIAKRLRAHKVTVDDIALILGVSKRNVQRYLKK